jgi:hypothetical protein
VVTHAIKGNEDDHDYYLSMAWAETMTMTMIVTHVLLPAPEYVSWVWEGAAHDLSRDHDHDHDSDPW